MSMPINSQLTDILPRLLRLGVALCYIGHGTFGVLTKKAWLPFFDVVGVPESLAWKLMPWVGTMDVMIGFAVLFWPCRALYAWAVTWAIWTALLRPLANQGWPEFFERAGNYGVPLALLALYGTAGHWGRRLPEVLVEVSDRALIATAVVLRLTIATLLLGHSGCALLLGKPSLAQHYEVFSFISPARAMQMTGYIDLILGLSALFVRKPYFFLGVAFWKLASEGLFITSQATAAVFEVIERGGSYVAPLALAVILRNRLSAAALRGFPSEKVPDLEVRASGVCMTNTRPGF